MSFTKFICAPFSNRDSFSTLNVRCQCSKSIYTTILKRIPSNELWISFKQKNCSFFPLFIHVVASDSFGCASAWAINASLNNIIIKIWTVWTLPNVTNRTHRNATHRFLNEQVKKPFFLCFFIQISRTKFCNFYHKHKQRIIAINF